MVAQEVWLEDNLAAIKEVWNDPTVYPWLGDDMSPPADQIDWAKWINDTRSKIYICKVNRQPVGVVAYWQLGSIVWDVHIGFVNWYRGAAAIKMAKQTATHMFNTGALKLVAEMPSDNRAGLIFALRCGMKREGINRSSIVRRGRVLDQIYLGVCKNEWRP